MFRHECAVGVLRALFPDSEGVAPDASAAVLDCTGDCDFTVVYAALRCGYSCTVVNVSPSEGVLLPGFEKQHTLPALLQKLGVWVKGQEDAAEDSGGDNSDHTSEDSASNDSGGDNSSDDGADA